jgi:sterol desaturase/sphingolipid hydroxylase (fatty acid hydroxylase superfamily)
MTVWTPVPVLARTSRRLSPSSLLVAALTGALLWYAIASLERTGSLGAVLAAGRAELLAPAVLALVVAAMVCERVWPADGQRLAQGHLHDAAYAVLHVVAVVPLMTLLSVAFGELVGRHAAFVELPGVAGWPRIPLVVFTLVLMDGANWLAHWADHRFGALWRFHELHHSQEELSVLTSFRAHPLSHLAGFCVATVPVVVILGDRGIAPVLVTSYICLGTLPHANVKWRFGPLGRLVVSPAYHRLHHSPGGSLGINLAVVLTIWDVAAGRARFPQKGAPTCPTGLAGRPVAVEQDVGSPRRLTLLATQLLGPFLGRPAPF